LSIKPTEDGRGRVRKPVPLGGGTIRFCRGKKVWKGDTMGGNGEWGRGVTKKE